MCHSDVDERLGCLGQKVVVLGQAAIPPQPGKGALHHPTTRQNLKAFPALRLLNNLKCPPVLSFDPFNQLAPVATIGPDVLEAGKRPLQVLSSNFAPSRS